MTCRSRAAVLLAVVLTTGGLAGCSGSSGSSHSATHMSAGSPDGTYPGQSAEQLLAAAMVAARKAKSVRISGSLEQTGRTIEYSMTEVTGQGTAGTVSVGGATARVRRIGTAIYALPSKKFLVSQAGSAGGSLYGTLDGRWLKADEQIAAAAGLGNLSEMGTLSASLDKAVPTNGALTRTTGTTVDGEKTTGITFAADGQQGTVYVSATAPGYPLQVKTATQGTVTFSHWDQAAQVSAPAKFFDIADLDLASLGLGSVG
jgi:hypothetical protein